MGGNTKSEDPNEATTTEDMKEWAENVTSSFKNLVVHFIMLVDGIITIDDAEEMQGLDNPQ